MALKPVIAGFVAVPKGSTFDPASPGPIGAASPAAGTFTSLGIQFSPGNIYGHIFFSGGVLVIGSDTGELSLAPSGSSIFMTALDTTFNHVSTAVFSFGNALNGDGCVQQFLNASSIPAVTGGSNIGSLNGVMSVANDGETLPLPLARILLGSATWTTGSIAPNSSANQSVSVTGAKIGSPVVMNYTADLLAFFQNPLWDIEALVVGADTVQLTVRNADPINSNPLGAIALSFSVFQ